MKLHYPTITYTPFSITPDKKYTPGNEKEVYKFIGPQDPCPICNDYGEYEENDGPHGCMACNSRLIFFKDHTGKRVSIDWGDSIEKRIDGLHAIYNNKN